MKEVELDINGIRSLKKRVFEDIVKSSNDPFINSSSYPKERRMRAKLREPELVDLDKDLSEIEETELRLREIEKIANTTSVTLEEAQRLASEASTLKGKRVKLVDQIDRRIKDIGRRHGYLE